jgi:pimeloyl-ACP methyl ester carboxylesterase
MPAVPVDLPSCGPDRADLHGDAAAIRRVLDEHANSDITLVAHSYGGIPATEAAAGHPSVRRLVYLAAYNADHGETLAGFAPDDPDEANIRPPIDCEMSADGLLTFRPDRATEVLFHDCPEPEEAARHLRPMSPAVLTQSPNSLAWKGIPSVYVISTEDRATAVSVQRRLSQRADEVLEIASGHVQLLAQPERVAEIIVSASRGRVS